MKKVAENSDFGPVFWAHIILLVIGYFSPFLFDIRLIILGYLVIYAHWIVLDDCFLTKRQFLNEGEEKVSFNQYYLKKAGLHLSSGQIRILTRYVMPGLVILLAIFVQGYLGFEPLIF